MLRSLTDPLISVIFPRACKVCSAHIDSLAHGPACDECWKATKFFTGHEMLCDKCGAFFSDEAAAVAVYCKKCDDHSYDRAFAVGVYEKALAAAILELKTTPRLSIRLKRIVKDSSPEIADVDLLIPVPLSKQRMVERGYNQAALIAKVLSENYVVPSIYRVLLARRTRRSIEWEWTSGHVS